MARKIPGNFGRTGRGNSWGPVRFTFARRAMVCPFAVMKRYGVKLNNGKIMWVQAEGVECRDGALLFYRESGGQRELIAGFSLTQVNHWGVPEAFAAE